ncbi:MAG: toxin-antitoxin system, antitoxin component, Xre family protein [Ardenticatenaceae bacterium]
MNNVLMTVPAHFDGTYIQLDVKMKLKPKTRLLVTVLDYEDDEQQMIWQAMQSSEAAFARVWDNEEDAIYDEL